MSTEESSKEPHQSPSDQPRISVCFCAGAVADRAPLTSKVVVLHLERVPPASDPNAVATALQLRAMACDHLTGLLIESCLTLKVIEQGAVEDVKQQLLLSKAVPIKRLTLTGTPFMASLECQLLPLRNVCQGSLEA